MAESGFLMNVQRDRPNGIPTLNSSRTLHNKQMPPALQSLQAEADENILIGQPLYLKQNGHLGLACGDDSMRSRLVGLALSNASVGHACSYTNFGNVQRDDWNLVTGSELLKTSQIYYLGANLGEITNIAPEIGYLVELGMAINEKMIALNVKQSILL